MPSDVQLPSALSTPRAAVVLALTALAGSALGLLVIPAAPSSAEEAAPPVVHYLGAPLPLGKGAVEEALTRTRSFTRRSFALELPDGSAEQLSLASLGASIDTARLSRLIADARDPASALRRGWARRPKGAAAGSAAAEPPLTLPVPLQLDPDSGLWPLLHLKDAFDQAPESARLDLATRSVLPHKLGRRLDVDATFAAIEAALARGELRAKATAAELPPARRSEELADVRVERVLGYFETTYSREQRYAERTFNLRLAASRLDGTVLLPGEVFDFNAVVGPRDEASGYKVATVIADGELVDGIGGGTCQISGTLHGAAFFAGLGIVERYPHTRPSSYIKMGLDATVVYPTINFRVKNEFPFPVVLHETVREGKVRAEVLGPPLDQVVTLIRRVDEALPYEQLERPDPELPRGHRVLAQRGIPGFRLHRYRVVRRGNHTVRERWRDIYPPTAQILRVGTGPGGPERATAGVKTPEYTADELLVLTLRRPTSGDAGEFAENREPGRFGREGWTRELGMPFWAGD
jgi:vancomycin resistance protein YoaR